MTYYTLQSLQNSSSCSIQFKYSFSQRTVNEWNKLSTDCVDASSVIMFKNKVDISRGRVTHK